jgi:peptidoglycan/LPS O-acetylase OafA/YrhL
VPSLGKFRQSSLTLKYETRNLAIGGWRGIAILLVLFAHTLYFPITDQFVGSGNLGVDLFFVISGYTITARLLEEESSTSVLGRFYIRRVFRILPPVCVYLATLCVISTFFKIVSRGELLSSLFFWRNYQLSLDPSGPFTGHFWSLSIEEHFYLLWPVVLIRASRKRALFVAIFGAIATAVWRAHDSANSFLTNLFPAGKTMAFYRVIRTDQRLDGLLVGCILAIVISRRSVREFIFRNFPILMPVVCAVLLVRFARMALGYPWLSIYVLFAIAVASTIVVKQGPIYQLLCSRPLVWIGRISYSLYIWQELFLLQFWQNLFAFYKHPLPLGVGAMVIVNLACTFAAAACSFYFIERPCIAFGRRISQRIHARTVESVAA